MGKGNGTGIALQNPKTKVRRLPLTALGKNIYTEQEYVDRLRDLSTRMIELQRMRKADSQVGAILRLVKLPIRQNKWDVIGGDATARDFVKDCLFNRVSWKNVVRLALTFLDFGFSIFEQVYELEDGKFYLKKLQFLPQSTIYELELNDDDTIKYVIQHSTDQKYESRTDMIEIPAKNCLVLVNEMEGDYTGTSILRNCYGNWKVKDILVKIDAIQHDRFGVGLPMAYLKAGYTQEDISLLKTMLKNIRAHESGYMIIPPNTEKFEIWTPKGTGTDVLNSINYHDTQISKSILGQFLDLGTSESGNRALGETFVDMFLMSLNAIKDLMTEVINEQVVKPMVEVNFGDVDMPKLTSPDIQLYAVTAIAEILSKMTGYVKPNRLDNISIRKRLGLEVTEEEEKEAKTPVPKEEPVRPPTGNAGTEIGTSPPPPIPQIGPPQPGQQVVAREFLKPGQQYFREIKGIEQYVDFQQYAEDLDNLERGFSKEIISIRTKQVKSLIYDITSGVPFDKLHLRYQDLYGKAITNYSKKAFMQGAATVPHEKKVQLSSKGVADVKLYELQFIPEQALELINVNSQVGAAALSSRTKSYVGDLYVLYKGEGLNNKEIARKLYDSVLAEGSGSQMAKDEFKRVGQMWGKGREAAGEEDSDIQGGFYSAILDGKACEECAYADMKFNAGHEEPFSLDEIPDAPNPDCLGGQKCRCIVVYEYFRERGTRGEATPVNLTEGPNDPRIMKAGEFTIKANAGDETAYFLNKTTGEAVVNAERGNATSVDISKQIGALSKLPEMQKRDILFFHNHSTSLAFSPEDIAVAAHNGWDVGAADNIVFGNDKRFYYRFTMDRKSAAKFKQATSSQGMFNNMKSAMHKKALDRINQYTAAGKSTFEANVLGYVDVNVESAKAFGYKFEWRTPFGEGKTW